MLDTLLISCLVISISVDVVRSMHLSDSDLHYTEILALVPLWDKCLNACGDYLTGGITYIVLSMYHVYMEERIKLLYQSICYLTF